MSSIEPRSKRLQNESSAQLRQLRRKIVCASFCSILPCKNTKFQTLMTQQRYLCSRWWRNIPPPTADAPAVAQSVPPSQQHQQRGGPGFETQVFFTQNCRGDSYIEYTSSQQTCKGANMDFWCTVGFQCFAQTRPVLLMGHPAVCGGAVNLTVDSGDGILQLLAGGNCLQPDTLSRCTSQDRFLHLGRRSSMLVVLVIVVHRILLAIFSRCKEDFTA